MSDFRRTQPAGDLFAHKTTQDRNRGITSGVKAKELVVSAISGDEITGSDGVVRHKVGDRRVEVGDGFLALGGLAFIGTAPLAVSPPPGILEEEYLELLVSPDRVRGQWSWWLVNSEGAYYLDLSALLPSGALDDNPQVMVQYGEGGDRLVVAVLLGGEQIRYFYVLKINRGENASFIPAQSGVWAPSVYYGEGVPVVDAKLEETIDLYTLPTVDLGTEISYSFSYTMYYPIGHASVTLTQVGENWPHSAQMSVHQVYDITNKSVSWHSDVYEKSGSFSLLLDRDHIDPERRARIRIPNPDGAVGVGMFWNNYYVKLVNIGHRRVGEKNEILLLVKFILVGPPEIVPARPRKEARFSDDGRLAILGSGGWRRLFRDFSFFPFTTKLEKLSADERDIWYGGKEGGVVCAPLSFQSGKEGFLTDEGQPDVHMALIGTLNGEVLWKDSESRAYSWNRKYLYSGWREYTYDKKVIAHINPASANPNPWEPVIPPDQVMETVSVNVYGNLDVYSPLEMWRGVAALPVDGGRYLWGFQPAAHLVPGGDPPLYLDIGEDGFLAEERIDYPAASTIYDTSGRIPDGWKWTVWVAWFYLNPGSFTWTIGTRRYARIRYGHNGTEEFGEATPVGENIFIGYNIELLGYAHFLRFRWGWEGYESAFGYTLLKLGSHARVAIRKSGGTSAGPVIGFEKLAPLAQAAEVPYYGMPPVFSGDFGLFTLYSAPDNQTFLGYLVVDVSQESPVFTFFPDPGIPKAPEALSQNRADFLLPVLHPEGGGEKLFLFRDGEKGSMDLYAINAEDKKFAFEDIFIENPLSSSVQVWRSRPVLATGRARAWRVVV